jgi:hypothetical protein
MRGRGFVVRRSWVVLFALTALAVPAAYCQEAPKKDEKVTLELRDAPLSAVLKALAARQGLTLVLPDDMPERVSLSFNSMLPNEAFDQLLDLYSYKKELSGARTLISKRGAAGPVKPSSDEPLARLYIVNRLTVADAVAGIASITSARAVSDALPTEHELLVTASPADHTLVKSWLERIEAPRFDERTFRLAHHAIAGVSSAAAVTEDAVAREVAKLLTPAGLVEADLASNALRVCDDARTLERVAQRIAELDRPPAKIALEAVVLEQPIGAPLRGFAPLNEVPAAFCDEGTSGPLPCFAYDDSPVDALVTLIQERDEDEETTVLDREATRVEERKAVSLGTGKHGPRFTLVPRLVGSTVEVTVKGGDIDTRVRLKPGRAAAIRGLVKVEKWRGGWGEERTELVLFIRAMPDRVAPSPRPAPAAHTEKLPPLALPGDWDHKK